MTAIDQPIPDFSLPTTSNKTIKFSDLKGKNIVLYFYPKDCTPGCTRESQDFRDQIKEFDKLNTVIFGVSRDNLKLHEKFKQQENLPFELISDANEELCQAYKVINPKTMYGKLLHGIERSTFLIDAKGVLRKEWRKVKVEGHVAEVLAALKDI